DLRLAERKMDDIKGEGIPTEEKCEKCGKPMNIRLGRNGAFLACTAYPDCDGTRDLPPELAEKYSPAKPPAPGVPEQACEKCGKRETLGIACPEKGCAGEIVVRRSKRGPFYGCTRYPECKFTSNHKPVAEPCPSCGAPVLFEKTTKTSGTVHYCRAENCKY